MDFPCIVCNRSFSRPQDRLSHLTLSHDPQHRAHLHQQSQTVGKRFRDAAASARKARFRRKPIQIANISRILPGEPRISHPMDVDTEFRMVEKRNKDGEINNPELLLDEEGSIASEDEDLEAHKYQRNSVSEHGMNDNTDFDFLPAPTKEKTSENSTELTPDAMDAPMPHRSLVEDDEQSWTWKWHPTAGEVFERRSHVHKQWSRLFSGNGVKTGKSYKPFASRLEWEVVQWAVQEKVSQKSFDRRLKIPQLRERLGITFNSAHSMFQKVDSIPERCGRWFTKKLTFKDRPDEHFVIRHQNPVDAIKALWGDPSFSNNLMYKPAQLFRSPDQTANGQVYNEMWTAGFWNAAQKRIPEGGDAIILRACVKSSKVRLSKLGKYT
ncbi:hypothetical protein D9757_015201 [Collybiopsis confluens]|uniref:C2H2-type domain-containing protein n=1 Tax=Collybiopsis confluens TaxID=2823264 RepID=A0A8H5CW95_9AGAR|nr:hypothetical protein D9757_015201 [Collybiopsis confluens]